MKTLIPYLPKDLSGKKILITGCTNDLGRNTAYTLAEKGAKVILVGDKRMELEETFLKLKSTEKEANYYEVLADYLGEEQLNIIYTVVDRQFHGLDILINNDIADQEQLLASQEQERHQRLLSSLQWHYLCASEAIKRMQKNGGGYIYNITSVDDGPCKRDPNLNNTLGLALNGFNKTLRNQIDGSKIQLQSI
jgi:NAD(P)-dependent dehydrogenase (short-subunit alcohol dehydrogenase family)